MTQGTKPALPSASRHGCGDTRAGQRAHAVRSLPALLRLWVSAGSSTFPGLSQHKTHLGRILFPPRVITGPAKSHLLFAVTGLTALLLVQFDCNRGLFTGFDGRGGAFPPICAHGKEALGAIAKDRYPLPKSKDTISSLQGRCHPPKAGRHLPATASGQNTPSSVRCSSPVLIIGPRSLTARL